MPSPDDLIGSAEACRLLGDINRSTLTRWVEQGRLPVATRVSNKKNSAFLFKRSVVERLARHLEAERARAAS